MVDFSMRGFTNNLVLFTLNDSTDHWCDYAEQTIQLIAKQNTVVVFCLGNYTTWKDCLGFRRRYPLLEHKWNALLYHPFFIIPGQRFPVIKKMNFVLNAWAVYLSMFLWYPKKKKYFWFFDPYHVASIITIFSNYSSVYDCVDYYSDVLPELCASNKFLFSYATYVFANSLALANKIRTQRQAVSVVPLGFAEHIFCRARVPKQKTATKTVGFVGGITPRIDFVLLYTVAKRFPNVRFVFYGNIVPSLRNKKGRLLLHAKRFFSLQNVFFRGYAPKKDMPTIIQSFDIAIIPYTTDSFNTYSFPMKIMEYFYMGKPVVSSPIVELKRFSKFVYIAHTPKEWEAYIEKLLQTPWLPKIQKAQRAIAMEHTWKKKIEHMIAVIHSTTLPVS